MAMKPIPKLIIIVAVVGGIGYGIDILMKKGMFAPHSTVVEQKVEDPRIETPAPIVSAPAPTQEVPYQPPQSSDPSADRGLNQLIESGKR